MENLIGDNTICFTAKNAKVCCLRMIEEPRVVYDGDYTIYYDEHGNKTIVHKMADEPDDKFKAVVFAILKSKGVKPKEVMKLVENGIDKKAKREERKARIEKAKQNKLNKE